ncbi:hypothetical protein D3C80_1846160 [compost metagenome]
MSSTPLTNAHVAQLGQVEAPGDSRRHTGRVDYLNSGTPLSFCNSSKSMSAQISITCSPSDVTSSTARSV